MRKIQMVDLKSQYEKIKSTVDASIQEVLDTTTYINGPKVHEFQKNLENYLDVKHVIPCANGTDALQIAIASATKMFQRPRSTVDTNAVTHVRTMSAKKTAK